MIAGFDHFRSKRYWALIVLGPPLRVVFAYAVFAGLHLGLGLPWPTLGDAGLVASMLEMLSFLVIIMLVDSFVVGKICGVHDFGRRRSGSAPRNDWPGFLVAAFAMVAGFAAVMAAPFGALTAGIVQDKGGWTLFIVLIPTTMHFVSVVREGERSRRDRTNASAEDAGV